MTGRTSAPTIQVKGQAPGAIPPPSSPATDRRMAEAGSTSGDGVPYDLGKLNRHWYRRCLDALGRTLNSGGTSPSVEELQQLCDNLVTSFLVAVTGQSPDSDRSQFPADRAYYIPFAGDRAGRFNFAKPYFQLLNAREDFPAHSLWSFLPWAKSRTAKGRYADISIVQSLDAKQATINFNDLLKSQPVAHAENDTDDVLRFRKSLLLRDGNDSLLTFTVGEVLRESDREIRTDIATALVSIFDVYRSFPGNAAIERILLNHLQILRWLWQLITNTAVGRDTPESGTAARREHVNEDLFDLLLAAYFIGDNQRHDDGLVALREWVSDRDKPLPDWLLSPRNDTEFHRAVHQRLQAVAPVPVRNRRASEGRKGGPELAQQYARELKELHPHFANFQKDFLAPQIEQRVEGDLAALSADDPWRSGEAKRSFVWVCADFANLDSSLPESFQARGSTRMSVTEAEKRLAIIGIPYRRFFQELEAKSLRQNIDAISSYWRTRGDAARLERVYGSFAQPDGLPAHPPSGSLAADLSPRPQNIFLRVRICDSLNEPMIDGLFVFTTDHDEVLMKGKDAGVRREDIEDLLAFGKVFFFIVRDHLHGLDRTRESADIGRLNQHLYDRRLADLDACMNARFSTEEFQRNGVSSPDNWSKFTYEVVNNFAYSLIEKPQDVRNETFPYDRLLVIPLPGSEFGEGTRDYDLPFYLFQALYVECRDQKIQKGLYSLLKPFQSPVEDLEEAAEDGRRFHARSFQEVSDADGRTHRLEEFLQKHYLSACESADEAHGGAGPAGAEPASYVVKTVPLDSRHDLGRRWTRWALMRFWKETKKQSDLWLRFLCDLTEAYRVLLNEEKFPGQDGLWFLCRWGLLRAVVKFILEEQRDDEDFRRIQTGYARELSLRFGGTTGLDLLRPLLTGEGADPSDVVEQRRMLPEGPSQIDFVDYLLGSQDRWVLQFLRTCTDLVCATSDSDEECETYYQDLLTRPVEDSGSSDEGKYRLAAQQIGRRVPPYDDVEKGQDGIATFLGVLNLTVGSTDLDRRRLRCVIAMIRDFDDTKTGRVESEAEARKRLEVDRSDLTLYTRTFFQNVHRFLTTARERQQVRILSTDITQIARSWYSSGIDSIVSALRDRLQELVETSDIQKLGQLRPEIIECAFSSLLSVLIRKEKRRDGVRDIDLESFPFDRILHIPLLFGSTTAARWCYARVAFRADAGALPSEALYEQIRKRGRHALLKGGSKIVAARSPVYVGPGEFFATGDQGRADVRALGRLAMYPSLLDRFVRRLNEAHVLQTLAVAGTIYHFLRPPETGSSDGNRNRNGWSAGVERISRELRGVMERSVRSLERDGESVTAVTEAHMERPVSLTPVADGSRDPSTEALLALFGDAKCIPLFREFFAAVEGPDYRYGLTTGASKLFYVYYSIPSPDGFIERDERDSRYRGLFCLIVDDAKTDDKIHGDGATLSDAEAADLDDIRTFVHNAMCSLSQVLGQQALQHRILRPGVAQDILGMMHRLKNELNGPASALSSIRRALAAPERVIDRAKELTTRVEWATEAIGGINELFQQMKRLSDFQNSNVPLQTFSSDWLAWTFLLKVGQACLDTMKEHRGRSGSETAAMREIDKICEYARTCREAAAGPRQAPGGALRSAEITDAAESVQKRLFALARTFGADYSTAVGTNIEFIFSFEAFTVDTPLEFCGSYLLDEALNTLVENAFQAMLSYVESRVQKQRPNIVGRIRVVCREHDEAGDEILIELRNSSNELPARLLEELNADPPRTISAAIHAEVSGKKHGSGFGHYFARRIISEYCGGREARRQIDIHLEYGRGITRTRLRLLKPEESQYRTVDSHDVARALTSEFREAMVLAVEVRDIGSRYCIPSGVRLRGLLRTVREILAEGVALKLDDFMSFLRNDVRADIMRQVDLLRERLIADIEKAVPRHPALAAYAAKLQDITECRRGSLHDLNRILGEWRETAPDSLQTLVSSITADDNGDPAHMAAREQLEAVLGGDALNPAKLIPESRRGFHEKKFLGFVRYIKPGAAAAGLGPLIDSVDKLETDGDGLPMPNQRVVAELFHKPRFAYALTNAETGITVDLWAHLLSDEASTPDFESGDLKELNAANLCDLYKRKMLGRTAAQLQGAFMSSVERTGSFRLFRRDATKSSDIVPAWRAQITLAAAAQENEAGEGRGL